MEVIQMTKYRRCPICEKLHNDENWRVAHPKCYSEYSYERAVLKSEKHLKEVQALLTMPEPGLLNDLWNAPTS